MSLPAAIDAFPMAPFSAEEEAQHVRVGDPALVRDRASHRHTGTLAEFDPGLGYLILAQPGGQRRVPFHELKLLLLPTLRHWRAAMPADSNNAEALSLESMVQDFRIGFHDGDQVSGRSLGSRMDQAGLYLYPQHDREHYRCLFIPRDAIKESTGAPRLGDLLVEETDLSPADINRAMDQQAADRKRRLGDYLSDKALVTRMELEVAIDRQRTKIGNLPLGDLLVSDGVITSQQLKEALADQARRRGRRLGQVLVDMGLVTSEQIHRAVAHQLGFPSVDLKHFEIDPDALVLISEEVARKLTALPLFRAGSRLAVAVDDPLDTTRLDTLRMMTNLYIDPVLAPLDDLEETINQAYALFAVDAEDSEFEVPEFEDDVTKIEQIQDGAENESFVVRLAHKIVRDAANLNASDIHFEAASGSGASLRNAVIRFRRDGSLFRYRKIPMDLHRSLIARYKVMADIDLSEHRLPLDGKINFRRFSRLDLEMRVATIPVAGGHENMVLRLLSGGEPLALTDIGLSRRDLAEIQRLMAIPHGLLLVCGPTGSGKTTTLHSMLKALNRPETKVWTAEDPVEITQPGLNQVQMHNKIGLNFATTMRALLRADPDVIMVGEMRDLDTMRIAIEASLTGHLVLSTIHTNTAPGSVSRLMEMGVDPFNFADSLNGVLAQRLVRKLCPTCCQQYAPDDGELRAIAKERLFDREMDETPEQIEAVIDDWRSRFGNDGRLVLRRAVGCSSCMNTGYIGRIGIYELLVIDEQIRQRILNRASTAEIRRAAIEAGMRTLREDGIEKALAGLTSMDEVRKVSVR
ncbi:MAG: Flp pilus assembly complex ATPase component TadA [Gammaproteobacteria bacterium]|nr:Flp pilus assembly complex ATPase component TadA [Gammaproteobacteria bacterium]MCP5137325.1 Flp pilus assembly complex ATPase component TadA [Gammaproteobacteria bacterium]